jgi:hypothetical protein
MPGSGSYASYCLASAVAAFWKCARSASVHQLLSVPLAANSAPVSSKQRLI